MTLDVVYTYFDQTPLTGNTVIVREGPTPWRWLFNFFFAFVFACAFCRRVSVFTAPKRPSPFFVCCRWIAFFFIFVGAFGWANLMELPTCCVVALLACTDIGALQSSFLDLPPLCHLWTPRAPRQFFHLFFLFLPCHLVYRPYYCTSRRFSLHFFCPYDYCQYGCSIHVWNSPVGLSFSVVPFCVSVRFISTPLRCHDFIRLDRRALVIPIVQLLCGFVKLQKYGKLRHVAWGKVA